MATQEYNKFSPKLRAELPKLKKGEKLRFQLLNARIDEHFKRLVCPNSLYLTGIDRIYDPWAKESKGSGGKIEYEGDYIDIAFVDRENPAPRDSQRDKVIKIGEIGFLRANGGMIELVGGNMAHEKMLPYLFFCNKNQSNVDKPWFVKPEGKPVYKTLEPSNDALKQLKKDKLIDQARLMITDMSQEERNQVAKGLIPNLYSRLSTDEIELQLRDIATKNPQKIMDVNKDVEVQTTAFIETCVKAGLIEYNKEKTQWEWADDHTMIVRVKAGVPHNALKRYFMTEEGIEVLSQLEKLLEVNSNPKEKEKKEKVEA